MLVIVLIDGNNKSNQPWCQRPSHWASVRSSKDQRDVRYPGRSGGDDVDLDHPKLDNSYSDAIITTYYCPK